MQVTTGLRQSLLLEYLRFFWKRLWRNIGLSFWFLWWFRNWWRKIVLMLLLLVLLLIFLLFLFIIFRNIFFWPIILNRILNNLFSNKMYLFNDGMMPNNWPLIINSYTVRIIWSLVTIQHHFSTNMSFRLKRQIKIIPNITNKCLIHINIIIISNIIKFFNNLLFILIIWLFIQLWILIFAHYWWLQFFSSAGLTHSLHWLCVKNLIWICYHWLLIVVARALWWSYVDLVL